MVEFVSIRLPHASSSEGACLIVAEPDGENFTDLKGFVTQIAFFRTMVNAWTADAACQEVMDLTEKRTPPDAVFVNANISAEEINRVVAKIKGNKFTKRIPIFTYLIDTAEKPHDSDAIFIGKADGVSKFKDVIDLVTESWFST
ncbi:MAG: hypothetical protein JKY10_05885 [Cohaesibacteraceae bacterium]|nr:hypothetical protein [Cohaesibacteraceae bacterium]